jgi:hypothetical protein
LMDSLILTSGRLFVARVVVRNLCNDG